MTNRFIPLAILSSAALALGACATIGGDVAQQTAEVVGTSFAATLSGTAEVPGPGDTDGNGTAKITLVDAIDDVCFDLDVTGIDTPTAAHVHRGAAGQAGPPVVTLEAPADGTSSGCVNAEDELVDEIRLNPADFYVNVHNAAYPQGAIRGQLRK